MMWKNFSAGVLSVALMAASTPVWAAEEVSPVITVTQGDVVTAVPAEKTTKASETNKPQAATEQPAVESGNTDKASVAGKTDEAALNSRRIMINLASRSLALYEDTKKIRLYPIGPGKPGTPTPVGYFSIRSKDVNPTWTDPEDPENSIASGESNPLGYRWMEIQGNYGIHGTNKPESIGHYVSNGCIRMNEKDVEALFELVKIGTPVEITYNRIVVEKTPDDTVAFYIYPDGYDRQPLDVAEVTRWLAGFGVQNFISDEDIQKKIDASDGEPTYIGKVYNITVDGKKMKNKAVIQDGITYLPAIDLADAAGVNLGWDAAAQVLTSTYGKAIGYDKKDVLYCNADDVATLYHLDGGQSGKDGFVYQKTSAGKAESSEATATTSVTTGSTERATDPAQPEQHPSTVTQPTDGARSEQADA